MQVWKKRLLPPVSLGLRKACRLLAQESKRKSQGESELSPWDFPLLSPDALHPGWRLRRQARSHNGTKPGIVPINSGRLLFRRAKHHPPMRVQGDHPPGQVWAESPAYPLCWPYNRYFFPLYRCCKQIRNSFLFWQSRRSSAARHAFSSCRIIPSPVMRRVPFRIC